MYAYGGVKRNSSWPNEGSSNLSRGCIFRGSWIVAINVKILQIQATFTSIWMHGHHLQNKRLFFYTAIELVDTISSFQRLEYIVLSRKIFLLTLDVWRVINLPLKYNIKPSVFYITFNSLN